jgi:hypothetical protein
MTSGHPDDLWGVLQALPERDGVELFFESPTTHEPGTHFVYSTACSYVLAAAVVRRSGQSLTDFLAERLFVPLGWPTPHWERDARGIEHGGTGLKLTTRQLAEFGQLMLQRGAWDGAQLVPATWIDQASAAQTRNPWFESHESRIGYGYQLWRSTHGYRADGMCGQFAVVVPELDLVVATTSGATDANRILEAIWSELLPGVQHGFVVTDDADGAAFDLGERTVPEPRLAPSDEIAEATLAGRTFGLPGNESGIERIALSFDADTITFELSSAQGTQRLVAGRQDWVPGRTASPLESLPEGPCAARAGWAEGGLELHIQLTGTPFRWLWRLEPNNAEGPRLTAVFQPDLGLRSREDLLLTTGQ